MNAEAGADADVTLGQFASVQAWLSAQVPLDEALTREGLVDVDWAEADAAWANRIATDEAWAEAFDEELAKATARQRRVVSPLDDPEKFAALVRALAAQGEPLPWLAERGLRLEDVTFALAHWTRRMKAEPAISEQLVGLLREARDFTDRVAAGEPRTQKEPSSDGPTVDEPEGPALFADLPSEDGAGPPPPSPASAAASSAPPALRPPASLRSPASHAPSTADPTAPVPTTDDPGATPGPQLPSFMKRRVAPEVGTGTQPLPTPVAARAPIRGATMMGVAMPAGPALPFAASSPGPASTATPRDPKDETAPFTRPARTDSPLPFASPRVPAPSAARNPLDETSRLVQPVRSASPLPFAAAGAPADAPREAPASRAQPIDPLSQTRPPDVASSAPATPFRGDPSRPAPSARPPREDDPLSMTMPHSSAAPASAATPFSRPTQAPAHGADLQRYVDLYAALARKDQPAEAVLARFGLVPETKALLDQTWERRFAADPTLRQQWLGALVARSRGAP